jgi:CxxC motif-containing protein (DUF1111 family)
MTLRVHLRIIAIIALACSAIETQAQLSDGMSRRLQRRRQATFTTRTPTDRADFGDPLPNLTTNQLAAFLAGKEEFEAAEEADEGLGPVFNNVSCVACHSKPATGGTSAEFVTRFGHSANGVFDPLASWGGSLLQSKAIIPQVQEVIPPEANVIAKRQTTPLFGLGLIEAISDSAILSNVHSRKPDGVAGRAAQVLDIATGEMRIGRFGWKAQVATIPTFAGDAYLNEMGITTRLFPVDNAPNGDTNLLALFDLVADPEDQVDEVTGKDGVDFFTDFMRLLGPPPPLPLSDSARAGETLFNQIGCAICHTPSMVTGTNSIRALDRRTVRLYSDLLLHDMGSLGDGIAQAEASPREMKTPPLWGLRARGPYLHDGRATTADAAIRSHDGEGRRSRERYIRLSPFQQKQLTDFLNSI